MVAIQLRRLINESQSFYTSGMDSPLDVRTMAGQPSDRGSRLVVDLQGVNDSARQMVVALLFTEILDATVDKASAVRPVFLVYEKGHNFALAG